MIGSVLGKLRDGLVGRPSLRAVAVSTALPVAGGPARLALSGGGVPCAWTAPAPTSSSRANAAATRRARRRVATQAHQMLISYNNRRGTSMSIIETASGGV